MKSKKKNPLIR